MASPIVPHPSTVSVSVLASMAAQLSHKTRSRASIGSAGALWQARRVSSRVYEGGPLVRRAAGSTVASLWAAQARLHPERAAVVDGNRRLTYGALAERVRRLAGMLVARGLQRGSRIAILSENRAEYLELFLAAAMVGAVVACQNCRLAPPELAQCLDLVEPEALFASDRKSVV